MILRLLIQMCLLLAASLEVRGQQPPPSITETGEDAGQVKLILEGRRLLKEMKPQEAIAGCFDKAIAHFEGKYREMKEQVYCSRTLQETLLYLVGAAAGKTNAVVLDFSWAEAHFLKGYALLEMGKIAEAKASLGKALSLSPHNSQFLSELGHCHQVEKDWTKALELYDAAEEAAKATSPDEEKIRELTRALRGQGYVLVELGKLDKATAKYEECLMRNPDDMTAKRELDYIRGLQKK